MLVARRPREDLSALTVTHAKRLFSQYQAKGAPPCLVRRALSSPAYVGRCLCPSQLVTSGAAFGSMGVIAVRRQDLHTSACCFAPLSSSNHSASRTPSAADNLLSLWSRRSPSVSVVTKPTTPPDATATRPQHEDASMDSLSVEALLSFDDEDAVHTPTAPRSSVKGVSDRKLQRGGGAALLDVVPSSEPTAETDHPSAVFPFRSEEFSETDDDVYGMAASPASLESRLMEELLEQASLNAAKSDLEEEPEVSGGGEGDGDGDGDGDDENSPVFTAGPPGIEVREKPPSLRAASAGEAGNTVDASFCGDPSAGEGDGESPSNDAPANGRAQTDTALTCAEASEGEEPASIDEAPLKKDGEAQANAEEIEDEEDESLDTVLEEETERMLQVALANMVRESAASAASMTTTASGTASGPAAEPGSYVFFSKEAVMAAAESLAATEKVLTDRVSVEGAGVGEAVSTGMKADFDDDVVRAVEMESLGLNMETLKP
jgi:hypothetical protein